MLKERTAAESAADAEASAAKTTGWPRSRRAAIAHDNASKAPKKQSSKKKSKKKHKKR